MKPQYKKGYKTYCHVTIIDLIKLFNKSERTIRRWIDNGKLNPNNLKDIIDLYNKKK